MKRTKELKEIMVGAKLPSSLVVLLDADATKEGTSRSHILRRALLQHYQRKSKTQTTAA